MSVVMAVCILLAGAATDVAQGCIPGPGGGGGAKCTQSIIDNCKAGVSVSETNNGFVCGAGGVMAGSLCGSGILGCLAGAILGGGIGQTCSQSSGTIF